MGRVESERALGVRVFVENADTPRFRRGEAGARDSTLGPRHKSVKRVVRKRLGVVGCDDVLDV